MALCDISDFLRTAVRPAWSFCAWGAGLGFTLGTVLGFAGGVLVRVLCPVSFVSDSVSLTCVVSLLPTSEVVEPPRLKTRYIEKLINTKTHT